jgi:hypothetical protein
MACFDGATVRDAVEIMHDGASLRFGKAKVWQFRSQAEIDRQTGFTIALPSAARDGTAEAPRTPGARFDHGKRTRGYIDPQKLLQPSAAALSQPRGPAARDMPLSAHGSFDPIFGFGANTVARVGYVPPWPTMAFVMIRNRRSAARDSGWTESDRVRGCDRLDVGAFHRGVRAA